MQKIGNITSTADANGEWTGGNVAAGTPPTIIDAAWLNTIQRELINILTVAGLSLDPTKDNQVMTALTNYLLSAKNNLSEIKTAGTAAQTAARSNLGLGSAAVATVGTGSDQLPSMASFTSSLSQNGWFKLPSGIIFQWGQSAPATTAAPDVLVNFPIPFPNGALAIGEHDRSGASAVTFWQINNLAQSGFYAAAIGSIQRGNNQVIALRRQLRVFGGLGGINDEYICLECEKKPVSSGIFAGQLCCSGIVA